MHRNRPFLVEFKSSGWELAGIGRRNKELRCDIKPVMSTIKNLIDDFKPVSISKLNIKSLGRGNDVLPLMHKVPPVKVMLARIKDIQNNDMLVCVNGKEIPCHNIVLAIYCKSLRNCLITNMVTINSQKLSARGFAMAYQWMVTETPEISPNDVLELLSTAMYLQIDELEAHCWNILDRKVFNEFSAFSIIFAARHLTDLPKLSFMMSGRISKSTLTIFTSYEYIELTEQQVCYLLQSSSLAANSEQEILYGALLWLDYLWPLRIASVANVLCNIRYCYMSPIFLYKLQSQERNELKPFGHIYSSFYDTGVMTRIVEDGLFGSSVVISSGDSREYIQKTTFGTSIRIKEPRVWIQDSRCSYHIKVGPIVPNMLEIKFEDFTKYLKILQSAHTDFDTTIESTIEKPVEKPPGWRDSLTVSQLQLNLDLLAAHKARCNKRKRKPQRGINSNAKYLQHSKTDDWEKLLMQAKSWYIYSDSADSDTEP